MTKPIINEDCIGCGLCENLCPEAFEISAEGKAVGIECTVAIDELEDVASQCPVEAITVS